MSAIKRVRQNAKRRVRNRIVRTRMRTYLRRANDLLADSNKEEAVAAVSVAVAELDRAAQKGIIHKNNASRHKSQLMRRLNAL